MSGILDMLAQHMNPGTVNQVSNQIGTDQPTAQRAITAALPTLFGAMAQHASTPQGATEIHQAVTSAPADGAVQPPAAASAGGLLGKILGPRQPEVEQQVAQQSGLSRQQAGKVLMYLAPIAVAVLARHHAQQPQATQQPGGLTNILQSAQQAMQGANAGGGGGLGQVLGGLFG